MPSEPCGLPGKFKQRWGQSRDRAGQAMTRGAYYNEHDPSAAQYLRNLIRAGIIAPGDVDERSIADVQPDDLRGYAQCHFFAGIGGWSIAARMAGWSDDRELWTGSCPCQPFSQAGRRLGADDPRHLWPHLHRLIRAGRPACVMGEQVAGQAGRHWFHGVRSDLAASGYASRAVDIPACAVDAPHQRQRLYWVAVADATGEGRLPAAQAGVHRGEESTGPRDGEPQRLHGANGTFWSGAEWIECHDGKRRRTEPSIRLLVDGLPTRSALWRAIGNAISPALAAEVIKAFMETSHEQS